MCFNAAAGSYQLYVPEVAAVGEEVGRVSASDEDEGQNADMTYSITNTDAASLFTISTDEEQRRGIISLKKVSNQTAIEFNGLKYKDYLSSSGLNQSILRLVRCYEQETRSPYFDLQNLHFNKVDSKALFNCYLVFVFIYSN